MTNWSWKLCQDSRKNTHHFRGDYGIYFELIKEIQKVASCNLLDLKTTRILTIMSKISSNFAFADVLGGFICFQNDMIFCFFI
jgi:hypothetical protein